MNPNAPRSFNHATFAALPEYQAARRAVDTLIGAARRAIDEGSVPPVDQATMAEAGKDFALSAYAADNCPCCARTAATPAVWPHAGIVEGGGLLASYRCPSSGHEWICSWTADPDLIGMMP